MFTYTGPFDKKVRDLPTDEVMEDLAAHFRSGHNVRIFADDKGFLTRIVVSSGKSEWVYERQS